MERDYIERNAVLEDALSDKAVRGGLADETDIKRIIADVISAEQVYNLKLQGYSFNKISQTLGLDWGCVKQRYEDFIHDNPELLKEEIPSEKYKEFYEKKKAITERLRKDNEDFEK